MINQFDFSEKGWVRGKGRSAVWRDIPFEEKLIEPQYLMARGDFIADSEDDQKATLGLKAGFLAIGSATNSPLNVFVLNSQCSSRKFGGRTSGNG